MSVMDSALEGLNFFEVIFQGDYLSAMTVCTYRPKETVEELFKDFESNGVYKHNIWDVTLEEIKEDKGWFPIFCVELRNEHGTLESLAEDLFVSRLSGVIDREMKGMEE
jgi:hypothetical protein